ncbi:hypothetical protein DV515_00012841 [Chloebia gouldiae]|uniref:Uncharacterized protein n=1 Tax=Chloebia gouldiae TaxID=44316 RepID=A0A3L8S3S1_CHLGU|nr:hypothetical protein DV515_00012841 [Chloebia gouldiae]
MHEKLTENVLPMVMKHNYLFFSISDENKEAWKSLEGEGELKSDSKKKEKKSFERSGGTPDQRGLCSPGWNLTGEDPCLSTQGLQCHMEDWKKDILQQLMLNQVELVIFAD